MWLEELNAVDKMKVLKDKLNIFIWSASQIGIINVFLNNLMIWSEQLKKNHLTMADERWWNNKGLYGKILLWSDVVARGNDQLFGHSH